MLPMMLKMYTARLGDAGAPLQPRIGEELQRHLGYIENALQGVDWLVGDCFSGADIQLSFVAEITPLLRIPKFALTGGVDGADSVWAMNNWEYEPMVECWDGDTFTAAEIGVVAHK